VLALVVHFGGEALFKQLICKDAGLGKTINPLTNVTKVVIDDDFVRDDVEMETHVFRVWRGGVQVEIGKVDAQNLSPHGADGGIDEEFDRGEISRWSAFVT
jgi:hypothetical protein